MPDKNKTMKRLIIITYFFIFAISHCKAQPNGGFENWTQEFNYQNPDGWQTLNFMSNTNPPNPLSAFKATGIDKHSGSYALKLKTIFINNNIFPGRLADTGCAVFTGSIAVSPFSYRYGFPYTSRPDKLEFWFKYIPVGGDTAGVIACLRKWNGAGYDTVAFGGKNIPAEAGYTLFQLDLIYKSTEMPDSAVIAFASSKLPTCARQNSTLFIDDVTFTGTADIDHLDEGAVKIKIFPNPAKDNLTIEVLNEAADNVQVFDAFGKLAGIYKIYNYNTAVNTGAFAEGCYTCEIRDKKNKILAASKFNVIK